MSDVSKPWYRKWWGITLIAVLAIGVIGNLGDSDESEAEAESVTTTTQVEEATTTTQESTTTTVEPTTTTTERVTTTTEAVPADASDFMPNVIVVESTCYGSAGANVRIEIEWGFNATSMDAVGTLTYEIRGLDDGAVDIASIEVFADTYQIGEHFVGIPSCDPSDIEVVPTGFRP